jgi:hypothetical protein
LYVNDHTWLIGSNHFFEILAGIDLTLGGGEALPGRHARCSAIAIFLSLEFLKYLFLKVVFGGPPFAHRQYGRDFTISAVRPRAASLVKLPGRQSEPFGFCLAEAARTAKGDGLSKNSDPIELRRQREPKGGWAAFVKPDPQAVGDRCAADGFADHGMDGSRCRPAMALGEFGDRRACRAGTRIKARSARTADRPRAFRPRSLERVCCGPRIPISARPHFSPTYRWTLRPRRRAHVDKLQRARPRRSARRVWAGTPQPRDAPAEQSFRAQ